MSIKQRGGVLSHLEPSEPVLQTPVPKSRRNHLRLISESHKSSSRIFPALPSSPRQQGSPGLWRGSESNCLETFCVLNLDTLFHRDCYLGDFRLFTWPSDWCRGFQPPSTTHPTPSLPTSTTCFINTLIFFPKRMPISST